MKKIYTSIIVLTILLCGCGTGSTQGTDDTTNSTKKKKISDDLYDFTFEMEDAVYQLPVDMEELADDGWKLDKQEWEEESYDEDTQLSPGDYANVTLTHSKKSTSVSASLTNLSKEEQPITEVSVTGITVMTMPGTEWEPPTLKLSKGIKLTSSYDDLVEAYGDPTTEMTDEEGIMAIYEYDTTSYTFAFFDLGDGMELSSIMLHGPNEAVSTDKKESEKPLSDKAKEKVDDYEYPSTVGTVFDCGRIKLDDDIYQLPIPGSVLVNNGWKPMEEIVVPALSTYFTAEFVRNNQQLAFDAENDTEKGCDFSESEVVSIYYDSLFNNHSFELPSGITQKSTLEEVIAAYGEPDESEEYERGETMIRYNGAFDLLFEFDTEDGSLSLMKYGIFY